MIKLFLKISLPRNPAKMFFENKFTKYIHNPWLRYNVLYFFAGIIIGTFVNLLFQLVANDSFSGWRNVVITYVISILITLSIANISIISRLITSKKFKSPFLNIAMNYVLIVLGILIGSELSFLFISLLFDLPFSDLNQWRILKLNFSFGLIAGTIIYMYHLQSDNYNLKIKEKEMQLLKLNEQKTQSDLRALQAQINPHFLYNALNSITSLINEEPDKAEEMTIKLSKLFRYSLNTQETNFVSVKEEMEIVKTYLDIEKVRFGNRISFKIDADKNILQIMIPRFLLQPLVENALKHGLSHKTGGGLLKVNIARKNEKILITVQDNGSPFPEPMLYGYGLQGTHDKLNLLYGDSWKMIFVNEPEKKIIIELQLEI